MISFTQQLAGILPEILLVATAIFALLSDLLRKEKEPSGVVTVSILGLVGAGLVSALLWDRGGPAFSNMVLADNFSAVFRALLCFVGAITVLVSPAYLQHRKIRLGEYYPLLIIAVFGMMVMVSAADLLLFFLGLEIMSIALYVLACLDRRDVRSTEAALKYFILGAFSTAFLLFGIALLYAVTTSTSYEGIAGALRTAPLEPITVAGIGLLLIGFAFKVAAVPFHFWSPDVYQGAPTPVTAFMSVGPKAAAFVALIRVFGIALESTAGIWMDALAVMAMLTMTLGNIVALRQQNIKRMLAYSSIAHAGYLLIGIVSAGPRAFAAMSFYLVAYALMNLGAFTVAMLVNRRGEGDYLLDDYKGAGFAHPLLGATMTIFLFSLAGIPPTAGFFGKLYLFSAAMEKGHILLVVVAVLNSALAAYYYLRIIGYMYMVRPEHELKPVPRLSGYAFTLLLTSFLILLLGSFPAGMLNLLLAALP
ncbi:MAG: NADH-quinone oxidoreductase subunit N [bacterium]